MDEICCSDFECTSLCGIWCLGFGVLGVRGLGMRVLGLGFGLFGLGWGLGRWCFVRVLGFGFGVFGVWCFRGLGFGGWFFGSLGFKVWG